MAYETGPIDTIKQRHSQTRFLWSALHVIVIGDRVLVDIRVVPIGHFERQKYLMGTVFVF